MISRTSTTLGTAGLTTVLLGLAACSGGDEPSGKASNAGTGGTGAAGMSSSSGGKATGGTTGTMGGSGGSATGGSGTSGTSTGGSAPGAGTGNGGSGAAAGSGATANGGASGSGAAGTSTAGTMSSGGMAPMAGAAGMGAGGAGQPPTVNGALFTVTSKLASAMDAKAPTTVGIVTWSVMTVMVKSAYIEFGLDTKYGMQAPVDLTQMDYRTLLLGMKPMKTYHFRVVASDGTAETASDDYTIETGAATTAVKIGGFSVKQEMGRERGFIVTSYWAGSGSSVAFILDADGDIVWAYDTGMSGGIARARMSYDGQNLWAVTADNGGQSIRRVGMDGMNAQTYSSTKSSHDIAAVKGGTMAYLDYSVSCNDITEIDPSGTTKKIFTASGVFGNQCHGNAVRYSEAEDEYTYSVVDKDVIRVSRAGEKLWSLASTVSGGNSSWGGVNHGHHLLKDSILIFANKGASGGSAMIEYDFTGKKLSSYDGATSANLGDVQRLPGGNTLVDFSNADVMQEVDSKGTVLVEITGPGSMNRFGYATWRPTLYGPSPDITD
ncbi:MAG TPA: hypothetical protein VFV94_12380 [Polyangiaceae bacterium]|nr:hypothetical protein [Polyangiaceae bacterium]